MVQAKKGERQGEGMWENWDVGCTQGGKWGWIVRDLILAGKGDEEKSWKTKNKSKRDLEGSGYGKQSGPNYGCSLKAKGWRWSVKPFDLGVDWDAVPTMNEHVLGQLKTILNTYA